MPNHETAGRPLPFRTCIPIEGLRQAERTSSIDAEWEALSVASTPESALQTVSARPRFETLPGLGAAAPQAHEMEWTTTLVGEPSPRATSVRPATPAPAVAQARRSGRSRLLGTTLAGTLALSLAFVAALGWRDTGVAAPAPSVALGFHSNLVAASPDPSPPPTSNSVQPRPSAVVLVSETRAPASKAEPAPTKPPHQGKPAARSTSAAARQRPENPMPRLAAASSYRAHKGELASTDNPY